MGFALAGGTAYFRAYWPLINLPKCTACHGADHTVRGIIDIRSDVTAVVRAQALTIGGAGASFLAVVTILTLVIGSFPRRVVLRPEPPPGPPVTDAGEIEGLVVGAGVASGPIIQGRIGSPRRADFTVIGDSVNLASRLCGIARGLQVIVSDSTKSAVGNAFQLRGPHSVKVKGKSDAQRAWLLAGPVTRRPP